MNLWAVPVEGGPPFPLTTGAGDDQSPQISPDGRLLVYTNTRVRHVLERFDPRTGQRRQLLDRRASIMLPEISPDRRQIAFFSRSVDGIQLFTLGVDGGEPFQVTRSKDLATSPRWSGDGKELFYYNFPADFSPSSLPSFRRIPAAGGESVEVVGGWTWNHQNAVCLAPSGTKLAYGYRETRSIIEARVRDLSTGAEYPLEQPIGWCQWSSDGQYVLGTAGDKVFLCPADGATCRLVTHGANPRFAPDGQSVLVIRSPAFKRVEIWKVSLDGGSESRVAEIDDWNGLSSSFNVLPSGELIWNSYVAAPPELWVADLDVSPPTSSASFSYQVPGSGT